MALRRIRIPTPTLEKTEKTFLDADYTTGTALTVVNNYGFDDNDIAIIGEPGEEKTEDMDVTGYTGDTQVDISNALDFPHNKGCVVYRFEYDQVQIYRDTGAGWALLSLSYIQWDKRETIYVDHDASSAYSYRYRFICSVDNTRVSGYSPTLAGSGFTRKQVGYMIEQIRKVAGDQDRRIVTDDELIRQFNRAQDIIKAKRDNWWFLLVDTYQGANGIATEAGVDVYSLATYTDLNYISTMRFNFNDGTDNVTYHLSKDPKTVMEYRKRDEDATDDDWVAKYSLLPADSSSDQGYIRVWPTPATTNYGTFYPDYYKEMADLDDVADETDVPIPSILEDFALAYVFKVKGDELKARIYEERFFGPTPQEEKFQGKEPTGLRLLEQMQNSKNKAVDQPRSLKTFRGRRAIKRLYQDHVVDRDTQAERYF